MNCSKVTLKSTIPTRNLKQFTIKAQQFINGARNHCFLSRFDHRDPCSRGAQGLRSCDMEYVMLHLIFSLPHAWGGTTHSGMLPLLFDSRDFSVGSSLSPHNDFHFAPRSEIVALCERCS